MSYKGMSDMEKFINSVHNFNKLYSRVHWDSQEILEKFGRRSLVELTQSKEIHYLSCLERHYVLGHQTHNQGIPTNFVIYTINRPFQQPKLASRLELQLDFKPYTFTSATSGDKLQEGSAPLKSNQSNKSSLNARLIDPSISLLKNFDIYYNRKLYERFPFLNLYNQLEQIAKKSSPHHLKRVRKIREKKHLTKNYL